MADVSAIIIFHGEGYIAPTSIQSFLRCCDQAAARGLTVERIAVIDRPDDLTRDILRRHESAFDRCVTVDFGDLGESRNEGRRISKGQFLAFFDGDDLWGDEWIWRGLSFARDAQNAGAICHPEVIYYFTAEDYLRQSRTATPASDAKSYYFIQRDSRSAGFDPTVLLFNNIWTANCITSRRVHEDFPYRAVDRASGFGVEDWTWNAETLAAGIRHAVVPGTVHCIRVKDSGSLSAQNVSSGLLPPVFKFARDLERL